jgi:hypothetical protein
VAAGVQITQNAVPWASNRANRFFCNGGRFTRSGNSLEVEDQIFFVLDGGTVGINRPCDRGGRADKGRDAMQRIGLFAAALALTQLSGCYAITGSNWPWCEGETDQAKQKSCNENYDLAMVGVVIAIGAGVTAGELASGGHKSSPTSSSSSPSTDNTSDLSGTTIKVAQEQTIKLRSIELADGRTVTAGR